MWVTDILRLVIGRTCVLKRLSNVFNLDSLSMISYAGATRPGLRQAHPCLGAINLSEKERSFLSTRGRIRTARTFENPRRILPLAACNPWLAPVVTDTLHPRQSRRSLEFRNGTLRNIGEESAAVADATRQSAHSRYQLF